MSSKPFTLPRIPNVHQQSTHNIRNSESFPRINEAEGRELKKKKRPPKSSLYTEADNENVPKPLFNSFTLNDDPKVAKHMPFNEVIYPTMFGGEVAEDQSASLDSYWVSGFIDRAVRDGNRYDVQRKENRKKILREMRKAKQKDAKDGENGDSSSATLSVSTAKESKSDSSNTSPEKSQSAGSRKVKKKHRKQKSSAIPYSAKDLYEIEESIKKIHPTLRAAEISSLDSAPSFEPDYTHSITQHSSLSVNDNFKLRQLEERSEKPSRLSRLAFKPLYQKKMDNYLKKDTLPKPPVSSFEIENFFDRERVENDAATKLQKAYIHSCVVAKVRNVVKAMLAAVVIQARVRGNIARKWTAIWFKKRTELITQWQARVRKWYSNRHVRPVLEYESQCATMIQKIVLGKLARARCVRIRQNLAAERIQVVWRGVLARARSDRLWLNRAVMPIQCKARSLVSRRRYKSIKTELSEAALIIQRCFRSWFSLKKLAIRLRKREDAYREYTAAQLAAEEEWCEDTLLKMGARLKKKDLESKIQAVVADYILSADEIHRLENEYLESQRQKSILSARAIEQGWVQELSERIRNMRSEMTKLKLKFCFQKVPLLRSFEESLEERTNEIDELSDYRDSISFARDEEVEDNRLRDFFFNAATRMKQKQQDIAFERRKWAVRWYKPDGKPDRQRRPGRAWDKDILAGPDKMTYCPTTDVNLNDENRERPRGLKSGSEESVKAAIGDVSLQSYLAQVAHYEKLLTPLADIMKANVGAPPDNSRPHPKDSGWGEVASDLPMVMENIGAVPNRWRLQREQREREEKEAIRREERLREEAEEQEAMAAELRRIRQQQAAKLADSRKKTPTTAPVADDKEITEDEQEKLQRFKEEREEKKVRRLIENEAKRIEKEKREERERIEAIRQQKRRKRLHQRRRGPASIPWALLDELEGEKKKFESEKNFKECFHKF